MNKKGNSSVAIKTAILIDGGFFLKRLKFIEPKSEKFTPGETAHYLNTMAHRHVEDEYLYRIFYYDCIPFEKKLHNPLTNSVIDFSTTTVATFSYEFYECLKKLRKFALRLGYIKDNPTFPWKLRGGKLKDLIDYKVETEKTPGGEIKPELARKGEILEKDLLPDLRQKGVDIRIGVDIASLAYKKLVDKIILISGDSDFVPAAKIARREGIDFVLDPMWNYISPDLFEHIDGLRSVCPKPKFK